VASRLGRRIAIAIAAPAAAALAAVGFIAVGAARAAERVAVVRRMEATAEAVAGDPRFFLAAPLDAAGVRRRLAEIAGFDFVLSRAGQEPLSSLPGPAAGEALAGAPPGAHGVEVRAGGAAYLAVRRDRGGASLLLLFPTEAVDRAGRDAALPVLLASLAGLAAAAGAGLLLGERLSRPLRSLADEARSVAGGGERRRVEAAAGPVEARDLAAGMNAMLEALRRSEEERVARERLAVLGEFAAGVAHEIRNPLSSMRLTLQLLGEGLRGKAAEDLALLLDEVGRLEASVEEMLLFAGKPRFAREPVDLAATAREAARLHARQADHLGVAVVVEEAPGGARALGDGPRLRTCAANLLLNAVQASPRGSSVTVRAGPGGFEVADRGTGIPPEVGERVFEPFFSGRPGGTGLGLAVTRRIVEGLGGRISWTSGAAGTVFRVELPPVPPESGAESGAGR
jgi:signal transduction histidine kinase